MPCDPREQSDDAAMQVLSDRGAMCGDCGDEPGDRLCERCESCRADYITALRAAGWAPRAEVRKEIADEIRQERTATRQAMTGRRNLSLLTGYEMAERIARGELRA